MYEVIQYTFSMVVIEIALFSTQGTIQRRLVRGEKFLLIGWVKELLFP